MNKGLIFAMLVIASMSFTFMGCKSWAPSTSEAGKCSTDRQWVAPKQDPSTGEWKEGYCEWLLRVASWQSRLVF